MLAPEDMRVLFVLPRIVAGGVERVTLNLINGLQMRGVNCRLALGHFRGELLGEARALTHVDEVAARSNLLFVVGLLPVLREYRPTHVVTAFADVSLMTWLACRLARCRAGLIVGVHGTHQAAAALGGWRVRFQYHLYGWLAGLVYRWFDAVVAVSFGVADDVRERYPYAAGKLMVIYNPVFTVAMRKRLACLPAHITHNSPYRLVALGRLAYEKGFDVLLRAMPTVLERHDVNLVIYGEGVERALLEAQIAMLGLQRNVRLMGNTLDPLAALASADVFVFPSRHEGFSVTLVEALACGCQIVASDCPHGPAEILQEGKLGQLVSSDDSVALAAAIDCSLAGAVVFDVEKMRRRAESFSAEISVAAYLDLLQRLATASH